MHCQQLFKCLFLPFNFHFNLNNIDGSTRYERVSCLTLFLSKYAEHLFCLPSRGINISYFKFGKRFFETKVYYIFALYFASFLHNNLIGLLGLQKL